MKENDNLHQIFIALKEIPDRDPEVVQRNRSAFLREAAQLSEQPVSNSLFARLIDKLHLQPRRMQFSTLTIGILLAALMLTFSSGVYAARKSAPSQFLYPVKLWLEDSRLSLTHDPHEQIDLHLAYAAERLEEIESFSGKQTDPDLAAALQNFDDHYLMLTEEDDLDDVQEQRWEEIQDQYNLIHSEEDREDKDENEDKDQPTETEEEENNTDEEESHQEKDDKDIYNAPVNSPEGDNEDETESSSSDNENAADSSDVESEAEEDNRQSSENDVEETPEPEDDKDSETDASDDVEPTPVEEEDTEEPPDD